MRPACWRSHNLIHRHSKPIIVLFCTLHPAHHYDEDEGVVPQKLRSMAFFSDNGHKSTKHFLSNFTTNKCSYMVISSVFAEALAFCKSCKTLFDVRKIHARLISSGLYSSVFLQNHLLGTYSECNSVLDALNLFLEIPSPNIFSWNILITSLISMDLPSDADKMFDQMPERDSVSWNTFMNACYLNGESEKALDVFISLFRVSNCDIDPLSLSCALKACGSIKTYELGIQLHTILVKYNLTVNTFLETSLLDMYLKCDAVESAILIFRMIARPSVFCWNSMILGYSKIRGVGCALDLFDHAPERDIVTWNTILSVLSQHGYSYDTFCLFMGMVNQGFEPSSMAYSIVISACASVLDLEWGKHVHARLVRSKCGHDVFSGSALIDMYGKCGCLKYAKHVFHSLHFHNTVAWTSLITGFARLGHEKESVELFNQMRMSSISSDSYTVSTVLGVCSSNQNLCTGIQFHAFAVNTGYDHLLAVANALLTMYTKCERNEDAKLLFRLMRSRDVISWTCMMTSIYQLDDISYARALFTMMPERNIVTWNSMMTAYVQKGYMEECLKMHVLMLREAAVKSDWITYATVLTASAELATLRMGVQIMAHTVKNALIFDVSVANGIVTMYSKSGRIKEAHDFFNFVANKDLVSWNAMISGYAHNGQGKNAIEIFNELLKAGLKPDDISYISVLSGCSHSGLVAEGRYYFSSMVNDHSISPKMEHFACMVDLLGRAGKLSEAKNLIDEMPFKPGPSVWGALLGACRMHGNSELAKLSVRHLLEFDDKDSGTYVILANIYAESGSMDNVAKVRKLMKERGIRKNPGYSWIEVGNVVHAFTVDDVGHPKIKEIHTMLADVIVKIEKKGYINQLRYGSHNYHSEKLAVAFGLISLPSWMPISIMKNLRVCGDCHLVLKLISLVTSRELIVRDATRFHHFSKGLCSCGDYW